MDHLLQNEKVRLEREAGMKNLDILMTKAGIGTLHCAKFLLLYLCQPLNIFAAIFTFTA